MPDISNVFLSVIIPVYNTAKYLDKCLDSVCSQTLTNLEIICVDDASSDNSLKILSNYADRDTRIRVIHFNANRGVSVARNTGLELARGEYVGFVDSDDTVASDFYEHLYKSAKETQADIVKGRVNITDFDGKTSFSQLNDSIRKHKAHFAAQFWSAIYNISFLGQFHINFPVGLIRGQDRAFLFKAVAASGSLTINDKAVYQYRRREGSSDSPILTLEKIDANLRCWDDILTFSKTLQNLDPKLHALQCYDYLLSFSKEGAKALPGDQEEAKKICAQKMLEVYKESLAQAQLDKLLQKNFFLYQSIRDGDVDALMEWASLSPIQRMRMYVHNKLKSNA